MNLTPDQVNKLITGAITVLGVLLPILAALAKNRFEERKIRRLREAADIKEQEASSVMAIFVTKKAEGADQQIMRLETELMLIKRELDDARRAEKETLRSLNNAIQEIQEVRQKTGKPPAVPDGNPAHDGPQVSPTAILPEQ